jgi:hypothetical protein
MLIRCFMQHWWYLLQCIPHSLYFLHHFTSFNLTYFLMLGCLIDLISSDNFHKENSLLLSFHLHLFKRH